MPRFAPGVAIKKKPINPVPELIVNLVCELPLPPEIKRQIGLKMAEQYIANQIRAASLDQKSDLFATDLTSACLRDMTMSTDPGSDPLFCRGRVRRQKNHPASVISSNLRHHAGIKIQRVGRLTMNSEVHGRSSGQDTRFVFPERLQAAADERHLHRHS